MFNPLLSASAVFNESTRVLKNKIVKVWKYMWKYLSGFCELYIIDLGKWLVALELKINNNNKFILAIFVENFESILNTKNIN